MKASKTWLFSMALLLLTSLNLLAQISKGDVLISIDGNYHQAVTETGVSTHYSNSEAKVLNLGASAGKFVSDYVIIGVGLDYYWSKEKRYSTVNMNYTWQYEVMKIKTEALIPHIFAGYYLPITAKLYFNTRLKCSYGNINADYDIFIASITDLPLTGISTQKAFDDNSYRTSDFSTNSKTELFSAELLPELAYFITPTVGVSLGMGGISYTLNDWTTDNAKWLVNFNPKYWQLGFNVRF